MELATLFWNYVRRLNTLKKEVEDLDKLLVVLHQKYGDYTEARAVLASINLDKIKKALKGYEPPSA